MIGNTKYLIRKRALGDVLWIEPVIRELAPKTEKLIVHTKYNVLFENYPLENVVFKSELSFFEKILVRFGNLPFWRTRVINLDNSYEKNPKQHILYSYQQKAHINISSQYPFLYLSQKEKNQFHYLGGKGNLVVFHIENTALKNFRKAHGINWEQLVTHLGKLGKVVVTIGAEDPKVPGANYIKTSIREMIALIYQANLFIGVDSGPSHIAAALKVPALLFFGAVNPAYRHFKDLFNGEILQQYCEYAGCFHNGEMPDDVVCKIVGDIGQPPCCTFTTEQVINTINKLVNSN
jgi:ADP-heptose:LPS heptosyltransferase